MLLKESFRLFFFIGHVLFTLLPTYYWLKWQLINQLAGKVKSDCSGSVIRHVSIMWSLGLSPSLRDCSFLELSIKSSLKLSVWYHLINVTLLKNKQTNSFSFCNCNMCSLVGRKSHSPNVLINSLDVPSLSFDASASLVFLTTSCWLSTSPYVKH